MKSIELFKFRILISSFVFITLSSCFFNKKQTSFITPPIQGLDPEYTVENINAENGGQVNLPSGTVINIPPVALVNKKGKPITGDVNIYYREFHDAASIFLSGISMEYAVNGDTGHFITAGMFDLRAIQEENEVFIAPGKSIQVKMASFDKNDDFQFYWLDEENENWIFLDNKSPEINEEKELLVEELEKSKPKLEFPLSDEYFVFNYYSILDVYFNDDWRKIMDNEKNPSVKNKARSYGLSWTNIYIRDEIKYMGNYHPASLMVWKKIDNEKTRNWAKLWKIGNNKIQGWPEDAYVSEMKKISGNKYKINIKSWKDKDLEYSARIEAIMPLKSLFAFSPEHWKKNYDDAMLKIEEEEERLKTVADAFRTFEINKFGIYNWDKLMKDESKIFIIAHFKFDTTFNKNLAMPEIIYFPGNDKSLMRLPQITWNQFTLIPDIEAKMAAILPGNKLTVFEEFNKINFDSLKNIKNPEYTFKMKTKGIITNESDLRKLLEI